MSYYYNYYIGYEAGGKIYPLGPYDCTGHIHAVISRSSSFASNLHYQFFKVPEEKISDELSSTFGYKDWNDEFRVDVKYDYIKNIPDDDFVRKGYFLIEDVRKYESSDEKTFFDGFHQTLDTVTYSAILRYEMQFGRSYDEYSAFDYMYYAFPDYYSKEYESSIIREVAYMFDLYSDDLPKGYKLVVLETEG